MTLLDHHCHVLFPCFSPCQKKKKKPTFVAGNIVLSMFFYSVFLWIHSRLCLP